jgi:hypothetical protein
MLVELPVALPEPKAAGPCMDCERALGPDALLFAAPLTPKLSEFDGDVVESMLLDFPVALSRSAAA